MINYARSSQIYLGATRGQIPCFPQAGTNGNLNHATLPKSIRSSRKLRD